MSPHPHVVKRDSHFTVEVVVEERDLSVPLTEVIQHDELSVHLHPHANSLRRGAGNRFKQRSRTQSRNFIGSESESEPQLQFTQ